MSETGIPEDIERFILLQIESVAKLEALLLMHGQPEQPWDQGLLAQRLYISPAQAAPLLADLVAGGFCVPADNETARYCYRPRQAELAALVDRLAEVYSRRLIAITNLIHTRSTRSTQQFADAFKLRRDKEK